MNPLLVLGGLAVIGIGGYLIYSSKMKPKRSATLIRDYTATQALNTGYDTGVPLNERGATIFNLLHSVQVRSGTPAAAVDGLGVSLDTPLTVNL